MIDTDDKLPDDITLKNVVILLITRVIKDGDKFYIHLFLEEALLAWKLVGLSKCWLCTPILGPIGGQLIDVASLNFIS